MLNQKIPYFWPLVASVVICVVVIAAILVSFLRGADQRTSEIKVDEEYLASINRGVVFVKDLHDHVSYEQQRSIESSLYLSASEGTSGLYTGTIRQGSNKKIAGANGQSSVDMLIDVEPSQTTYAVNVAMGQGTPSVNVTCAPSNLQMNPQKECISRAHP